MGNQSLFAVFIILTWTIYCKVEAAEDKTCNEGENYLDVDPGGNCKKFFLCQNGMSREGSCGFLQRMNPELLRCSSWLHTNCSAPSNRSSEQHSPYCGSNSTFSTAHPVVCREYFECDKGVLHTRWCIWPKVFDNTTKECNWKWRVDCDRKPSNQTTTSAPLKTSTPASGFTTPTPSSTTTRPLPITTPPSSLCHSDKNWQAPFPDNCRKYYKCQSGKLSIESCFILRDFDPRELKCRFFWNVDCSLPPTTTAQPPPQTTPSKPSNQTTTSTKSTPTTGSTTLSPSSTKSTPTTSSTTLSPSSTKSTPATSSTTLSPSSTKSTPTTGSTTLSPSSTTSTPATGSTTHSPSTTTSTPASGSTITTTRPFPTTTPPSGQCHRDRDWVAPYPGDCKKYYRCQSGKLFIKSCFILHDFDPRELECRFFWDVDCTLPPTVPPPPQPTPSKSPPLSSLSYLFILLLGSITLHGLL